MYLIVADASEPRRSDDRPRTRVNRELPAPLNNRSLRNAVFDRLIGIIYLIIYCADNLFIEVHCYCSVRGIRLKIL